MQRQIIVEHAQKPATFVRLFLWVIVIAYMASLPHLIIVFKFILGLIPLPVIKALPGISLVMGGLAYLGLCRKRGEGYGLKTFIIPSIILIAGVFWLEPNPIKHVHIPLYAVLVFLIYAALRRSEDRVPILLASFVYASILGVFDEVHHGLHPERFFGWKDMVINAAGAGIGALFIGRLDNIEPQKRLNFETANKVFWASLIVVILNALVTTISVIYLFDVAQNGFSPAYPKRLFIANVVVIILSLAIVGLNLPKIKRSLETELVLFFPSLILASIQMLIVLAYAQNIPFQ